MRPELLKALVARWVRMAVTVMSVGWLAAPSLARSASTAAHAPCRVRSTSYEGWKAEEVGNDWVRLTIVPQLGGRLMQVTFNAHDYLFVNPKYKGKYFPPSEAAKMGSMD